MTATSYFLFDHEKFITYARPFIAKAQNGQYIEVIQHAQEIARQKKFDENWILEGKFESIKGFTDIDNLQLKDAEFLTRQTGFSFLVIFSQFLESLGRRYINLGIGTVVAVGKQFGWKKTDLKHFDDMNYPTLLGFEDIEFRKTTDAQWRNPEYFWLWFRPSHCFRSGWWSVEKLKHIHELLRNAQVEFTKINIKRLNASFPIDELHIRTDFALLEALLSYAIDYQKSLYFVWYP
jgi:hypothetical protein